MIPCRPLKNIPISCALTTLDHPNDTTYILTSTADLCFFGKMKQSLLPPAQVRNNGLKCGITPKQDHQDSIFGIEDLNHDIYLPFQLLGVSPSSPHGSQLKMNYQQCECVYHTSDAPWDPYDTYFRVL